MMFEATLEPPKKFDHLPPGNRRSSAPLTSFANRVSRCARNIALVRATANLRAGRQIVLCGAQITASIGSGGCLKGLGATITRAIQPGWRNWQTRWIQNPLSERACGFKSHSGHDSSDLQSGSDSVAILPLRRSDCLRRNRSFVAALLGLLCGFSVGPML